MSDDNSTPSVHDLNSDASVRVSAVPDESALPGYDEWCDKRDADFPNDADIAWTDMMEARDRAAAQLQADARVTAGSVAAMALVMNCFDPAKRRA